ncbi:TAXI family TRAP transporter solute-binding subunit [Ammoniphilus sp. YIM 78166]|uniref:TAXI family TRAP transporter solute-binding subunit n=1 Tax=Ammoniphilus sp. YIM 78166 TaxID=1644106 RepID=UPI00106FAF5A|nr:TAXI family TRAP transporter solute-binding subunit [Ammoniphilus sp. YIM 78166]
MKKWVSGLLVTVLAASLIGCGSGGNLSSSSDSGGSTAGRPDFLKIGGGSTGGVFFAAASGFAQLFSEKTGNIKASAQTTTGGGQNILLMADKELDLAIADSLVTHQAFHGEESFEGKANQEIRAIAGVYGGYFQQVVHPEKGIETFKDFKGKKMVVGGPSSGTENTTRIVYDAHGYSYTDRNDLIPEYIGISAGADQMKNKQVDGLNALVPYPFSTFVELTMTNQAKMISLEPEAIAKLTAGESFFLPATIPAGTYQNQPEDIHTVMLQVMLIAREDLDEELIYELTGYIFDNLEYLQTQHNAFKELTLETAVKGLSIPLHPGAERYYREKGVLK